MKSISVGDISLAYFETGKGPPLLLVHGFPLDHTMWKHQIADLSSIARLIAPDLRGFGKSGVTEGSVTMEQFADDLKALLDALGVAEPVTLCGLSMGGYIAFQFVRKYQQRVGKLILCDTRALPDSPEAAAGRRTNAQKVMENGPKELAEALMGKMFAPSSNERRKEDVEAALAVMLASPRQGIAAALLGMAQRPDSTALLPAIRVPTLVLVGEHDVISPPAEMRTLAAAIPSARFAVIRNAGHMAPLEQPQEVNRLIREFLGA
jgi:pimeloyl-ACP methyl ester carboxylesterase